MKETIFTKTLKLSIRQPKKHLRIMELPYLFRRILEFTKQHKIL